MAHKGELHPRNRHNKQYDIDKLVKVVPALKNHIIKNKAGKDSINWASSEAVLYLNKALLLCYYDLENWSIPAGFLTPPVPGRADYIHYLADLLAEVNNDTIPKGRSVRILDIGVGANCIYPIVGTKEYGWRFVGTEADSTAFKAAKGIAAFNSNLKKNVDIRLQKYPDFIFEGVLRPNEFFDAVICNPPFYSSQEDADDHALSKIRNLKKVNEADKDLNFGGQKHELITKGGEYAFISKMISESSKMPTKCFWYTTLVSKGSILSGLYKQLKDHKVNRYKTVEMKQGNKVSRFLAWTYLTQKEQEKWSF